MTNRIEKTKGFSILELLLSIAIISLFFAFSAPVLLSTQTNQNLSSEGDQILSLVRRAQVLSMSQYRDDNWGINIDATSVTMFKGNDYATRDSTFDEIISLLNASTSSPTEVYFEQITGYPNTTASVTFTATTDYEITLQINEQGIASI